MFQDGSDGPFRPNRHCTGARLRRSPRLPTSRASTASSDPSRAFTPRREAAQATALQTSHYGARAGPNSLPLLTSSTRIPARAISSHHANFESATFPVSRSCPRKPSRWFGSPQSYHRYRAASASTEVDRTPRVLRRLSKCLNSCTGSALQRIYSFPS